MDEVEFYKRRPQRLSNPTASSPRATSHRASPYSGVSDILAAAAVTAETSQPAAKMEEGESSMNADEGGQKEDENGHVVVSFK